MKRIAGAVLLLVWISAAYAEQPKNLEATMDDIANDLVTLQKDVEILSQKSAAGSLPTITYVKITGKNVPVYKGAADFSGVLTKLPEGKVLPVVDKTGEWYAVDLDKTRTGQMSGWVNANSVVPEAYSVQPQDKSTTNAVYQKIMDTVRGLKEKYQDNPYVRVTGFSVDVTIPPAVSISFEFK